MFRVDRLLQILIIITIAFSSLLLGMGQQDLNPFAVAVTGAVAAFVLVDWLRWFYLPQWLANLIAILVTAFTVHAFFFGDSVRQLMGVGKLLVYLQTILMFQRKSPRVYWQVLLLTLLQIVVGAVFNLGFEGGVLFILYMMVAGLTMMVLHLYQDSRQIDDRNALLAKQLATQSRAKKFPAGRPVAAFATSSRDVKVVRRMVRHFSLVGIGALGFALFLFYFLPRGHSSWSGPREVPMRQTGFSKSFHLNHPSLITLSSKLVMSVTYRDPASDEPVTLREQPYLRGMVLPNLVVQGNRTTWRANHNHIYYNNDFPPIPNLRRGSRHLVQDIVLEPTDDPLLYSADPPYRHDDTPPEFEKCWPLGAITRQRASKMIQLAHLRYKLKVPLLEDDSFFSAIPYTSRGSSRLRLTADDDRGRYQMYTYLDANRYPTIVNVAQQLVADMPTEDQTNPLRIAKAMEQYFVTGDRFQYTLDYRNVIRDPGIDSVEDFFGNFRSGHCEYFASALTLMLRSQGIPARIVVGYRGGSVNEFGRHIDVELAHGHAWVEAYILPEHCSEEMKETGQAGTLGAWQRLDPTPGSDIDADALASAGDALGMVRSLWRDYVLGLQAERSANTVIESEVHLSGLFRILDLEWWQDRLSWFGGNIQNPDSTLYRLRGLILAVLVFCAGAGVWWYRRRVRLEHQKYSRAARRPKTIRQRLGRWIDQVAPRVGKWIAGDPAAESVDIPFYRRFRALLAKAGFRRSPFQTQREFASEVALQLADATAAPTAGRCARLITDSYYKVRFGTHPLDSQQQQLVDQALVDLELELNRVRQSKSTSQST